MPAGHSLALELHFVCSRLLIVEPMQQIVAWYKPTHHKPILKRPIQGRLNTGWGSWIRTNTDGVRVRSSTIKLCPKPAYYMHHEYILQAEILTLFTEIHLDPCAESRNKPANQRHHHPWSLHEIFSYNWPQGILPGL